MKNLLICFALLMIPKLSVAQGCVNTQSSIDMHGNNIRARILNGGDLFTDHNDGQFIPNPGPPGTPSPTTIFAAGLWMGGVDPGINLKLATVDYRNNSQFDYTAGPLSPEGVTDAFTCANWDRLFRVTGAEIAAFQIAPPLNAAQLKSQFPAIAGWPGRGNPFFDDLNGYDLPFTGQSLAPYFDTNSDGLYNPLDGDYPVVLLRGFNPIVPAEIIWCVFNDQNGGAPHSSSYGKAFQMEIQLTAFAFNCPTGGVENNTIFTSHKFINRSTENVDSTFIGMWVDIDLGCYLDDYLGCNPALNTMYAYNQDAVDGNPGNTCQGTATFPNAAPVQSITFLNHPLSKFVVSNNGSSGTPVATSDPAAPNEYYNYLTGTWRDGTPLTQGGTGYNPGDPTAMNTSHIFPDSPNDPAGWSMCTANLASSDRRMLGTTKLGILQPGQVEELDIAWAFHPNPSLPCGLGTTFSDVAAVQSLFDDGFSGLCSPLKAPELPGDSLQLLPNPTSGVALLRYGSLSPLSIRAYDGAGRLVLEKTSGFEKEETVLETSTLTAGIYTLQVVMEEGTVTKKLVVVR